MKKLHLLKPNLVKGFLNNGTGDKVEYLKVPSELTMQALAADVDAGATAFEQVLEGAKKGLARVVMIRSRSKENALMAVNYLAGICNQMNHMEEDDDDFEDSISDEYDVDEIFAQYEDDDLIFNDELSFDDDDDCPSHWTESPNRLPIIDAEDAFRYTEGMEEFGNGGFISVGFTNNRNRKPYWTQCNKEAVCIMVKNPGVIYNVFSRLNMVMDRFQKNKQVFVIVLDPENAFAPDGFMDMNDYQEQEVLEFVLENTADLFYTNAKESEIIEYRVTQFENWAEEMEICFGKKFPKKEITEKIVALKSKEKSVMMEKVLKYVLKESNKDKGDELTKEDFAVLKKFKALSMEEKEKSNAKKLEKELIGMEDVKEQVRNIVSVMKYNKHREKLGIGRACYHNAHLLIGAPGTAKTTVAKLMGEMMFEENLLPGDRFICVNGADLKGMYVGHSAPKTHQIFENHDVILIDEAYSLTAADGREGMDSFSQEAIAQLILEIENHPMDKLVMFAGYGGINVSEKNNKMKQFIDANPGLKSRINSTIYFDSYTPAQMVQIVHTQAEIQKLAVDPAANEAIEEYFKERVMDQNFGNGREARSLLENAMLFAANRVMKLSKSKKTKKAFSEITKEDVQKAIAKMRESNAMQLGKKRKRTGFVA